MSNDHFIKTSNRQIPYIHAGRIDAPKHRNKPTNQHKTTNKPKAGLQKGLMRSRETPTDFEVLRLQPAAGHFSAAPALPKTREQTRPTTNNRNKPNEPTKRKDETTGTASMHKHANTHTRASASMPTVQEEANTDMQTCTCQPCTHSLRLSQDWCRYVRDDPNQ